MPAITICERCGDAYWADRSHECARAVSDDEYCACGGVWTQFDKCNQCGEALDSPDRNGTRQDRETGLGPKDEGGKKLQKEIP